VKSEVNVVNVASWAQGGHPEVPFGYSRFTVGGQLEHGGLSPLMSERHAPGPIAVSSSYSRFTVGGQFVLP